MTPRLTALACLVVLGIALAQHTGDVDALLTPVAQGSSPQPHSSESDALELPDVDAAPPAAAATPASPTLLAPSGTEPTVAPATHQPKGDDASMQSDGTQLPADGTAAPKSADGEVPDAASAVDLADTAAPQDSMNAESAAPAQSTFSNDSDSTSSDRAADGTVPEEDLIDSTAPRLDGADPPQDSAAVATAAPLGSETSSAEPVEPAEAAESSDSVTTTVSPTAATGSEETRDGAVPPDTLQSYGGTIDDSEGVTAQVVLPSDIELAESDVWKLQRQAQQCQYAAATTGHADPDCNAIAYRAHYLQAFRAMEAGVEAQPNIPCNKSQEILTVSAKLYADAVFKYHVSATPYIVVDAKLPSDPALATACANTTMLRDCIPADSPIQMPALVVNDYVQRIVASATTIEHVLKFAGDEHLARNFAHQFPRVLVGHQEHFQPLRVGPFGMHCAIMPVTGSLTAGVYPESVLQYLNPDVHGNVTNGAVSALSGCSSIGMVEQGNTLFVPAGAAFTWQAVAHEDQAPVVVIEHCFVDATNFNRFKSKLDSLALVDETARAVYRLFQHSHTDLQMERVPQALPFAQFTLWPRAASSTLAGTDRKPTAVSDKAAAILARRKPDQSNKLRDWQESQRWNWRIKHYTLPTPSQVLVMSTGRTNATVGFRCPMDTSEGGHRHDADASASQARKVLGYIVAWKAQSLVAEAPTHDAPVLESVLASNAFEQDASMEAEAKAMFLQSLAGFAVTGIKAVRFPDPDLIEGCGTPDLDQICINLFGLSSQHAYTFRVAAIFPQGTSSFSSASAPTITRAVHPPTEPRDFRAMARSTSVSLFWSAPADDGGSPVIGYVISRFADGVSMQQEYVRAPASIVVCACSRSPQAVVGVEAFATVHALEPGVYYSFKIAAVNAQGVGAWSQPTPRMSATGKSATAAEASMIVEILGTSSLVASSGMSQSAPVHAAAQALSLAQRQLTVDEKTLVVAASGTDINYGETVVNIAHQAVPLPCFGPQGVLSDTAQSLSVHFHPTKAAFTFVGWVSHFSPRTHSVRAELIAAIPFNGLGGLQNAAEAYRRILVFERGGIPLRDKALMAAESGAIGIVVIDNTGRCDKGFSQVCVPGADKSRGEFFAATDEPRVWKKARLPFILLNQKDGQALRRMLA